MKSFTISKTLDTKAIIIRSIKIMARKLALESDAMGGKYYKSTIMV